MEMSKDPVQEVTEVDADETEVENRKSSLTRRVN